MSFSDKLKLIIDVDTKGAISGLSGLKDKVGEADGFFGKLKAGAGGLGDMFHDLGPGAKAGLAAGGIAAAGSAAFAAVSQFSDLGVEVGHFAEATGTTTEEASRWIEVAADMGIDAGTLESALGKLNKSIDPAKFKELGIEIVKTKDGATDVNGTFLNVIDRLNGISDPAEKARVATQLLGKGWQSMAELVGKGSDELKTSLAAVADVKVLNPDDVEDARAFRDTINDLKDAGEELVLTFGKALLPGITAIAGAAVDLAGDLAPVIELLGEIIELSTKFGLFKLDPTGSGRAVEAARAYKGLREELMAGTITTTEYNAAVADDPFKYRDAATILDLSSAVERLGTGFENFGGPSIEARDNLYDVGEAAKQSAEDAKSAEAGNRTYVDLLNEEATAAKSAAAGILEQANAARSATDAGFAAADAQDTFLEKLLGFDEVAKDAEGDTRKLDAAYRDVASSAADVADATVRVYEETAAANGTTLTATEKQDAWNASMLDSAATAKGELRNSILTYIGSVNQIPPEKVSEIQALIDQGKLAEAKAALEGASKTREADIVADAKTAQAERDLQALARDRTANILVRAIAVGASVGSQFGLAGNAKGGPVRKGEVSLVGEEGPEIVQFGSDGTVYTANETRQMMSAGGGGGGSAGGGGATQVVNNYVTIHTREMPSPRELDEWISRNRRLGFRAA